MEKKLRKTQIDAATRIKIIANDVMIQHCIVAHDVLVCDVMR